MAIPELKTVTEINFCTDGMQAEMDAQWAVLQAKIHAEINAKQAQWSAEIHAKQAEIQAYYTQFTIDTHAQIQANIQALISYDLPAPELSGDYVATEADIT